MRLRCLSTVIYKSWKHQRKTYYSTKTNLINFQNHSAKEELVFNESFKIFPDFITAKEESEFMSELEPYLKRSVYEKNHWDNAIENYRETERKHWNKKNISVISRLIEQGFGSESSSVFPLVHILDLHDDGFIKPHVDSIKFCGGTVAVLSLYSDCVARFRIEKDRCKFADILVPRYSLYVMSGVSRYDYTHEILKKEESFFNGKRITKSRRLSIICRNQP